jgi:hypothetical protein
MMREAMPALVKRIDVIFNGKKCTAILVTGCGGPWGQPYVPAAIYAQEHSWY